MLRGLDRIVIPARKSPTRLDNPPLACYYSFAGEEVALPMGKSSMVEEAQGAAVRLDTWGAATGGSAGSARPVDQGGLGTGGAG